MDYIVLLTFCVGVVNCYSQYSQNPQNPYRYENHMYCDDLSPYFGDINLDLVSGVWHGVEKILHSKGEYKIEHTRECFYIDIKEKYFEPTPPPYGYDERTMLLNYNNQPAYMLTTSPYVNRAFGLPEQYRIRHFVLEWHEGLWQDDYHIKVNTSHKGFWPTDVPNASVDKMYRSFGGVIQVLKVSPSHLVLNFCMRLPYSQLYSVILSRNENQLTPEDLAAIHNIFTVKHLSTSSMKRVCDSSDSQYSYYNSAPNFKLPSVVLSISFILSWKYL